MSLTKNKLLFLHALVNYPSTKSSGSSLIIHDSFNHLVELGFDFSRKVGLNLIDLSELGEGPAAILPALGATSVNQMTVSTASTWQKNGRMLLNR